MDKMRPLLFTLIVLVLMCVLCLTSNQANAINKKVVKIGVILPLSGPLKNEALVNLDGHKFAVDEINANGGIKSFKGAKIELIVGDSRGDPTIGSNEAERLIASGAITLIGTYQSSVAYTSSEVAEKHGVPFLISTALSDILTKRGFKYIFRVEPRLSKFVEAQYSFIEDYDLLGKDRAGKIALLYERTLWGQSSAQLQRSYAHKKGYNIVADISYPYDLKDLAGTVKNVAMTIKQANPDIILNASYLNDSIQLARAFKLVGVRPKAVIGTGAGSKDPKFAEILGADGEYWMVVNEWSSDINRPGASDLNKQFQKRYGYDMNGISAVCYTAVWIIKEALEISGTTNGNDLRDAISSINIDHGPATILPMGKVFFDNEGNNASMPIITQIIDSKNKTVWPAEIASTQPVFNSYFSKVDIK